MIQHLEHTELDPNALDVVREENLFTAYYQGAPLTTPAGRPIRHVAQRLVEHLTRELALTGRLTPGEINTYTWFTMVLDVCNGAIGPQELFEPLLASDHFARQSSAKAVAENRSTIEHLPKIMEFYDPGNPLFSFVCSGLNGLTCKIIETVMELANDSCVLNYDDLLQNYQVFRQAYERFSPEQQAALLLLSHTHGSGFILPFLVIDGRITAAEYTYGLFLANVPFAASGQKKAILDDQVKPVIAAIRPDWQRPAESFVTLRQQTSEVLELLAYLPQNNTASGIKILIMRGEDFNQEFKSTLRRNLHTQKNDAAIEHACLKTLCAFLNSGGGTLLIGVKDDGSIQGIETDGFPNDDRFTQHFWNLVKSAMGLEVSRWIRTTLKKVDGLTVCAAQCSPSPEPVFLKLKEEEEFYIRVGPSSARLGVKDALKYIDQRFQRKLSGANPNPLPGRG